MAQAAAIQTYQHTTLREDLSDIVSIITPDETPFLSAFGQTTASNTLHEWSTDALAAPATNAKIQGDEYAFTKKTTPTRLNNRTQILINSFEVADTVEAANPAGYSSQYAHNKMKCLKEHARDIEVALVTGTGASGASGTAASLTGVLAFITGNVTTGTATGNETLTETMFNDTLELIWNDCSMDGGYTAYAPAAQKRKIDAFTAGATKYVESEDKRLTAPVNVYESTFGVIKIKLHRHMTTSVVAILGDEYWKTAWLRKTSSEEAPKTGDSRKGLVKSELTLESINQDASAQITQLS